MKKVRYGVIGTGPRGQALIKAALMTEEIEVVAVSDVQKDMLAQVAQLVPEAKQLKNYQDLLVLNEIDAVVVATPNHTHKDILLDCIAAKKHVLSEKPVATTLEDLDLIAEKLEEGNIIFQVGTELRYFPMATQMKSLVDSGVIGPARMLWCKEFRPPFKKGYEKWRLQDISGGSFLEKNCHHFDLFNWIAGKKPIKVSAFGGKEVIYQNEEVLDNGWVIIEYENGIRASLGLCLFQFSEYFLELGVLGELGRIEAYAPASQMKVKTSQYKASYDFENFLQNGFDHGGEVEQHLAFINSIKTGEPPLADIKAARLSHIIALAAEKSVKTGQTIYL